MSYNGWKNYETWAVGMFLDGNYTGEGTYREVLTIAEDAEGDEFTLAESLKEYVENDICADGIAGDLIGAALCEVDWDTLAEHKVEEVKEDE